MADSVESTFKYLLVKLEETNISPTCRNQEKPMVEIYEFIFSISAPILPRVIHN